jgi:class 3 adenylate cyclase/ActR/RegA family two-component response regulator
MAPINVLLADDNLIVREGLRALLEVSGDFRVVGAARDYDELIARAEELRPHVVVSDIRMPPTFQREGVDGCRLVRKRHPGTGVVILSQYDDPAYAVALLTEGAAGYAYLLKDRVSEGDQLARAIKEVHRGGSMLDPTIVESLVKPVEVLSRMLPTGIAERLRDSGGRRGDGERLEVTVLISDVRGYSTIAEASDALRLCDQLNAYRRHAADSVLAQKGTVMQYVGDAVMAVFGAPELLPDHADRALQTAHAIHRGQAGLNREWRSAGWPPFELGIGLSTGTVGAALLGSEERLEYSVVGDAVNLTQRLQQFASGGETVLSEATFASLNHPPLAERLGPTAVPGRRGMVTAYRVPAPLDR